VNREQDKYEDIFMLQLITKNEHQADVWDNTARIYGFYGASMARHSFYGPKAGFADVPAHSGSSEGIHSMFGIMSGTASYYY
jgi:hypothetical protein